MLPMPFPSSRIPARSALHQESSAPVPRDISPETDESRPIASRMPLSAEKAVIKAQIFTVASADFFIAFVTASGTLSSARTSSS